LALGDQNRQVKFCADPSTARATPCVNFAQIGRDGGQGDSLNGVGFPTAKDLGIDVNRITCNTVEILELFFLE
jgi:hypothetical protein